MHIKHTIMAYAFLVQCFENATIVAYAGLRVNQQRHEFFEILDIVWLINEMFV